MKRTRLILAIAAVALAFTMTSCEGNKHHEEAKNPDILFLNNGNWGDNNACISLLDLEDKLVVPEAFFTANSMHLGDLGQDMILNGEELYIAVNGSQVVFVTDKNLKIKTTVVANADDMKLSPRSFALANGKVYVTYYEGYLGEINPAAGYSVRVTKVGPNPEGVAYAGGKLYVANSGGYVKGFWNTVSVVDASSFRETATITVNSNPAAVVANASGTTVYVSSLGNYADKLPMVQAISIADGKVGNLDYENVSGIAGGKGDKLYVLCGGYDEKYNPLPGTIYVHNAANNTKVGKLSATTVPSAYSISADPARDFVFVGSSDYVNSGDMYVFDLKGTLLGKFDSKGLNPIKGLCL